MDFLAACSANAAMRSAAMLLVMHGAGNAHLSGVIRGTGMTLRCLQRYAAHA